MRLLVVEDDAKLSSLLKRGLDAEGYATDIAHDVVTARWLATETGYDVIVLDLMLPDGNGVDLCQELRHQGVSTPLLMLTARDSVTDRIAGLDAGADDYLVKPFSIDELLARLRALIRRGPNETPTVLTVGPLRLDPARRRVERDGEEVRLTPTEFRLLGYFMRHPGEALSRAQIISHVWDFAFDSDSNVVDVYVRYLRRKLDPEGGPSIIDTVREVGYRLRVDEP